MPLFCKSLKRSSALFAWIVGCLFFLFLLVPEWSEEDKSIRQCFVLIFLYLFYLCFMFCDVKIFVFSSVIQRANHTTQYKVQWLKGSQSPFLLTKTYLSLAT